MTRALLVPSFLVCSRCWSSVYVSAPVTLASDPQITCRWSVWRLHLSSRPTCPRPQSTAWLLQRKATHKQPLISCRLECRHYMRQACQHKEHFSSARSQAAPCNLLLPYESYGEGSYEMMLHPCRSQKLRPSVPAAETDRIYDIRYWSEFIAFTHAYGGAITLQRWRHRHT